MVVVALGRKIKSTKGFQANLRFYSPKYSRNNIGKYQPGLFKFATFFIQIN